jgi:hypothetical protein
MVTWNPSASMVGQAAGMCLGATMHSVARRSTPVMVPTVDPSDGAEEFELSGERGDDGWAGG